MVHPLRSSIIKFKRAFFIILVVLKIIFIPFSDLSNEEAIAFTSSRREKTSVYSGRKNVFYTGML